MTLTRPSIEKLFKQHFPRDRGLVVAENEQRKLLNELELVFESSTWESTTRSTWWHQQDSYERLCTYTLKDAGNYRYSYGDDFHFLLNENRELVIRRYGDLQARVSRVEELVSFARDCKQRIERQQALRKRREKVRGFKKAAMLAQLKKLGREEKFDFLAEFTVHRVKLWIKLDKGTSAIHIYFSPKRFQEIFPQLPEMIRGFREARKAGVSFKLVTSQGLPWRPQWINHRDQDEAGE